MNDINVIQEVKQIIEEVTGEDAELLKSNLDFDFLGIDDLDKMEIIVSMEEHFNISVSEEEFDGLVKIRDLINLVKIKTTEK